MIFNIIAAILFTFGMSIDHVQKREQFYCGAQNIYHESRGESNLGQIAVAHVVRNRVESPKYPNTVCEVVWQPKQFSWTHDGRSDEPKDRPAFVKAVWLHLIANMKNDITDGATNFYAHKKVTPSWASEKEVVALIGNHTFLK